jgi:hypothetical protein
MLLMFCVAATRVSGAHMQTTHKQDIAGTQAWNYSPQLGALM